MRRGGETQPASERAGEQDDKNEREWIMMISSNRGLNLKRTEILATT